MSLRDLVVRFTESKIAQHSCWAICFPTLGADAYTTIFTFGSTSLWMAILADVGTSLLVTLNGMRPLRGR